MSEAPSTMMPHTNDLVEQKRDARFRRFMGGAAILAGLLAVVGWAAAIAA